MDNLILKILFIVFLTTPILIFSLITVLLYFIIKQIKSNIYGK
jgi:hypothetical protein